MKSHVWRPLYVIICVIAIILLARLFQVPKDFGIHDQGYMYGFHRLGNEKEWIDFRPAFKFDGSYCPGCHEDKLKSLSGTAHAIIPCEDCHSPALDHPDNPPKLAVDRRRELCYRCHVYLPYPTSGRSRIRGINPETHNPGVECVTCHDPHHPNLAEMRQ